MPNRLLLKAQKAILVSKHYEIPWAAFKGPIGSSCEHSAEENLGFLLAGGVEKGLKDSFSMILTHF